ncbi:hypothetical protein FDZ71_01025 [bacterium]|nr:MAG: hypothetical protein FDZ71_01025 [bacterium]
MADEKTLSARLRLIQSLAGRLKGVKVSAESPKWSLVQGFLARSDRRAADVIAKGSPAIRWPEVLRSPLAKEILGAREECKALPWDFIAAMPGRELLLAEKRKALLGEAPDHCPSRGCRLCATCNAGQVV